MVRTLMRKEERAGRKPTAFQRSRVAATQHGCGRRLGRNRCHNCGTGRPACPQPRVNTVAWRLCHSSQVPNASNRPWLPFKIQGKELAALEDKAEPPSCPWVPPACLRGTSPRR